MEGEAHRDRPRIFASALLLVALALTCSAGPAFGLTLGHTYSSEFGSGFGTGNGQWAQTYVGTAGAINKTEFYWRCNYAVGVGGELGFSVNESSEGRVELVLGQEGVAPRIVQ